MGLDVYLKKFPDYEDWKRRSDVVEEFTEAAWGSAVDYDSMSEDEKLVLRDKVHAFAVEHGFTAQYDQDPDVEEITIDSAVHPEHMFKIGYWRSSYNEGGINRILGNAIGKDLHYIAFGGRLHKPEEYDIMLDWPAVKQRVGEVRAEFSEYVVRYGVRIVETSSNMFGNPADLPVGGQGAIAAYCAEVDRRAELPDRAGFDWYSNKGGDFYFGKPLEVVAAIPAMGAFNREIICLVYKPEDMSWYENALEVVEETVDYVLAQPDAEKYRVAWSG